MSANDRRVTISRPSPEIQSKQTNMEQIIQGRQSTESNRRSKSRSNLKSRSRKGILKYSLDDKECIEKTSLDKGSKSIYNIRGDLRHSTTTTSSKEKTSAFDTSPDSGDSSKESSSCESDIDLKTFPLSSTTKNSRNFSSRMISSKQYQQLFQCLQRINAILIGIRESTLMRNLPALSSIPSSEDKVSPERLSSLMDSLSEQLKSEVCNFIKASANDKTRLEQVQNENSILRQRLNTALSMQRNMDGELKQLSRENKLLETENKNLAIKIVPYLPFKESNKRESSGRNSNIKQMETKVFFENKGHFEDDGSSESSWNVGCNVNSPSTSESKESILGLDENDNLKRLASTGFEPGFEDQFGRVSESLIGSNDTMKRSQSDLNRIDNHTNENTKSGRVSFSQDNNRHDELDSITSYVRWKTVDFGRLHEKLNKNFEEMQKLKQTMTSMALEKEEILSDVEILADSCRDLSKEKDNYESILKMILREKNSPESNLHDLVDGLLQHLSNSCIVPSGGPYHPHRHSSKCFLEGALHAVHEQNIKIREEMTKMKETLQRTAGQNSFLLSSNEMLTGKLLALQKQLESQQDQVTQNEKDVKEKYDKIEELYKEVTRTKDALDQQIQEKEIELEALQNQIDERSKAMEEQSGKFLELKHENEKLEKEVVKYKINVEKMSQMILHLKASLREQKGKWCERFRSSSNDLQNTREHCKWLQSQIDNLNSQLMDAHERIKMHEKDKAILAQNVLTAEEERKTLDRKILEIKSIMYGDTVFREALAERNQVLQLEINRLRKEKLLMGEDWNKAGGEGEDSVSEKVKEYLKKCAVANEKSESNKEQETTHNTLDELSSIASAPLDIPQKELGQSTTSPLIPGRSHRNNHQQGILSPIRRKHMVDVPRAAYHLWFQQVSLHNPSLLCYQKK